MKKFSLIIIAILFAGITNAQFITLRATHATGLLSNNLLESNLSKTIGAEIYFSKPFATIPFNYNLGLDYKNTDGIHGAYAITGLTFIIFTPSGFSATNSESVTYSSFNWLNYADLNIYNGVQQNDSAYVYSLGAELGYNIGFVLGKYFFIHTGFGGRFGFTPSYKETANEFNSVDLMIKLGMLYKFPAKRYKP